MTFFGGVRKGAVIHIKDTGQLMMRQKTRKAENHSGQG